MAGQIVSGTDSDFEQIVVKSDIPVLVDFWAEWCGPCRAIAPALEEIANEFAGSVKVVKINIDENPEIPTQFGVRSIPTLYIFKNGEIVGRQTGALPKSRLSAWIKETLGL